MLVFASRNSVEGRQASRPFNVLLLVEDSLRPDHLTLYRDLPDKPTTPTLSRLAERGAFLYRDCQAQGTCSKASITALLTGRFPTFKDFEPQVWKQLRRRPDTLLSRLGRAGYRTYWGFTPAHVTKRRDEKTRDAFLAWRAQQPADRPWVAYLHFMGAHAPYRDREGRLLITREEKELPLFAPESSPRDFPDLESHLQAYDDAIRTTDAVVGELLQALEACGELERTVVVVTSDHARAWGEHGRMGHGLAFNREVVWVPLLIWVPGRLSSPRWIDTPVQHLDLLPTLLAACGFSADSSLPGRNLLDPKLDGAPLERPIGHGVYDSQSGSILLGVRRGRWQAYFSRTARGAESALYDLMNDPLEKRNIATHQPSELNRARRDAITFGSEWQRAL